jgi:hypothetical protein
MQILELPADIEEELPALNITHLVDLRKANPRVALPKIPDVLLPKVREVAQEKCRLWSLRVSR